MSLTIIQRPTLAFQANTCVHSAVGNPIIYKLQRQDYQSNTVANSAGNLRITLTGNLTSVISVSDSLYYRSTNLVYDGYYTVSTITYSAPDTTITFSGGYTAAGTTGFINLTTRLNYKSSIEVWDNDAASIIGTIRVSPDRRGLVLADVSRVLWSDMSADQEYQYNDNTVVLTNRFKEFYIKYQGIWIGSSIAQVDDVSNKYFAVYGANQIRYKYNGFLPNHVVFNTEGTESPMLLTTFTPVIWKTLPFTISAIIGQDIVAHTFFNYVYRDLDLNTLATGSSANFISGGSVVTFNLDGTDYYRPTASFVDINVGRTGNDNLNDITRIELRDPCDKPIMLHWCNSLSGDAWWCFDHNQEYSFEYEDGRKVKRMVLFAENLTLDQWEGINELNHPGEVFLKPFAEMTSSVNRTSEVIGAQVYMHDYRDTDLQIVSSGPSPSLLEFTCANNHEFSFANDDVVYINSNVYFGYFYARPTSGSPKLFTLLDYDTLTPASYTTTPTFVTGRRVRPTVGCVVIPTSQTTNTKQERHSISITIELPEILTT